MLKRVARTVVTAAGLLLLWQAVVVLSAAPPFILPPPLTVAAALVDNAALLSRHALVTIAEILLGFFIGCGLGLLSALTMLRFGVARRWLLPLLVASQALPVFAVAPLLMLWLGYGMASKVVMAVLIIYFPVTAAAYDGLRRTRAEWLDLAAVMGAGEMAVLRRIRLPAALPSIASGTRIAAAVAPIGAVVGEWVGAGAGLGYLMLHAVGRMTADLMFAALAVLAAFAVAFYFLVDALLRRALHWQADTANPTKLAEEKPT